MNRKHITFLCLIALGLFAAATSWATEGKFTHDAHVERAGACGVCHLPGALEITPDKAVCKNCHKQDMMVAGYADQQQLETHGAFWFREHKKIARQGETSDARTQCTKCHEQAYCRDCHRESFREEADSARVHRSDYLVTHPIMARRNPNTCVSCHEKGMCDTCHSRFNKADLRFSSHHRTWSELGPAGETGPRHSEFTPAQCGACHPDGVLPTHEWSAKHGREARRNVQLCQSCHEDADVCIRCHSSRTGLRVNPHPKGWSDVSDNFRRASDGRTCKKCH